jgi:hypothetical protein
MIAVVTIFCLLLGASSQGSDLPVVVGGPVWGPVLHNSSACGESSSPSSATRLTTNFSQVLFRSAITCNGDGTFSACLEPASAVRSILPSRGDAQAGCAVSADFESSVGLNVTLLSPLIQQPLTSLWGFVAMSIWTCGADLSRRRREFDGDGYVRGAYVVLDPSMNCTSLPVAMYDALIERLNFTCPKGNERYMSGNCRPPVTESTLQVRLATTTAGQDGVLVVTLPSASNGLCLRAHNSSNSQSEQIRLGRPSLAALNFSVRNGSIGFVWPVTASDSFANCREPECAPGTVFDNETSDCVDLKCSKIWFKRVVGNECANSNGVLVGVGLAVAVIGTGEIFLVFLRQLLEDRVMHLERRAVT